MNQDAAIIDKLYAQPEQPAPDQPQAQPEPEAQPDAPAEPDAQPAEDDTPDAGDTPEPADELDPELEALIQASGIPAQRMRQWLKDEPAQFAAWAAKQAAAARPADGQPQQAPKTAMQRSIEEGEQRFAAEIQTQIDASLKPIETDFGPEASKAIGSALKTALDTVHQRYSRYLQVVGAELSRLIVPATRQSLAKDFAQIGDDKTFARVQARMEEIVAGGKYDGPLTTEAIMRRAAMDVLGPEIARQQAAAKARQNAVKDRGQPSLPRQIKTAKNEDSDTTVLRKYGLPV